jgi:hypothetical protein
MAKVKRLFTGDVFTQRRRLLRTIRVVSAMSAASPLHGGTVIVSWTGHVGKCPTGDIALAAICCATITPE